MILPMDESIAARTPGEVGREWFEKVWGERNRSAIFGLLAADGVGHLEGGMETVGPEAFAQFHDQLTSAFPDSRLKIHRIVEQDNQVCVHWEFMGTHSGEGFGLAATGEEISFCGMTWFIVRGGMIVEGWDGWNHGGLMARLGAPDEVIRLK